MRSSFLLFCFLASTISAQFLNGYIHDGMTTYCWKSLPKNDTLVSPTTILAKGVGSNCPITLAMNVSKSSIKPFETLDIQWRVTISNLGALNLTEIIPSAVSSDPTLTADIVHSNVHSCEFGSNCDPFHDGRQSLTPTPNQYADFKDNIVNFRSQALTFTQDGLYSLVGHVILYGQDDEVHKTSGTGIVQYDFAIYDQLLVQTKNMSGAVIDPEDSPEDEPPSVVVGPSTLPVEDQDWFLFGILVGTLVLLLFSLTMVYVLASRRQQSQRMMSTSGTATHEYYTTSYCITPTNLRQPDQPDRDSAEEDPLPEPVVAAADEEQVFLDNLFNVGISMVSPRFQEDNVDCKAKDASAEEIESETSTTATRETISFDDLEEYTI